MDNEGKKLVIDIGNSRAKLATFTGSQLVQEWSWSEWEISDIRTLVTNQNPSFIILSNVAGEKGARIASCFHKHPFFLTLTAQTPLPFENHYQTPETLGKDRLAAVAGAWELYPGQNSLIVDAGTCITYDLLEANGAYRGGNISPGLQMRLQAMHTYTASLPLVAIQDIDEWVGYSTESAMRNGALLGAILEIQAFSDWRRQRYDQLNVILTGGDAVFFAKNWKREIFVHPNLVLIGLNKILDYNVALLE
jgi:type III pantothenate kinase